MARYNPDRYYLKKRPRKSHHNAATATPTRAQGLRQATPIQLQTPVDTDDDAFEEDLMDLTDTATQDIPMQSVEEAVAGPTKAKWLNKLKSALGTLVGSISPSGSDSDTEISVHSADDATNEPSSPVQMRTSPGVDQHEASEHQNPERGPHTSVNELASPNRDRDMCLQIIADVDADMDELPPYQRSPFSSDDANMYLAYIWSSPPRPHREDAPEGNRTTRSVHKLTDVDSLFAELSNFDGKTPLSKGLMKELTSMLRVQSRESDGV